MSIEQFEISIGSRIAQVPARQNLKAMQYQEARRKALEAAKAKEAKDASEPKKVNGTAVQEELIVHEVVVQEVINSIIKVKGTQVSDDTQTTEEELHAEFNTDEFAKLVPEVLPAQDSGDTLDDADDASEEAIEDTISETEYVTEDTLDVTEDAISDISETVDVTIDETEEPELYIEEILDLSEDDEDAIVLSAPKPSTIVIVDDDEIFEIQEIQDPDL